MTSTTTNKKEIVDFLWDWTESHSDWSKLLISKIVSTESELSLSDRQSIFNYFLQSLNLHTGLPALTIAKPNYIPTTTHIELITLSDIIGVNRLAQNQTITFSKNLTVIFGENGTGKTSYSRILKALGFSYDPSNTIHSNIFETTKPKEAIIKFKTNGIDETFNWNGINRNPELENISVFNNNCVHISLSDRQLIVSPIGFHLFSLVTSELNELTKLLNEKISSYQTTLAWTNELNNGTPQQSFISALSATSKEEKLIELSTFTPAQEQELEEKEAELSNLNKTLLQTEINNFKNQVSEIETLISTIQTAQIHLSVTNWEALIDLNKQIKILEKKTTNSIQEIAQANGIEFYETPQFKSFLKTAEEYIKTINKSDYPNTDDTCIYCLQPLESSAKKLLNSYRLLLNDKTQENLELLKQQKVAILNQVSQIDTNLVLRQLTFGADANSKPIQPPEIIEYNNTLGKLKTILTADKVEDDSTFTFDYQKYIQFLTTQKDEINSQCTKKQDILLNIAKKETELKNKIAELKDQKLLSKKISDVKITIQNHKIISSLKEKLGSFNTISISRKTSEAREQLIKSKFNEIFNDEIKALRKTHLKIDLNFGTDKGNSKVSQKINSYTLTDILSEGEQKAIALAEFLTELQLDTVKAPIIFDDPVNSLDHHIIDDVARRLIKLSGERQVIVFTHSVLLFNSFLYFSKQQSHKKLEYKFYNSKNESEKTGVITEAEEEINKVRSYISKINILINTTSKSRPEAEIAEDGYGHLRSAIELFVEHEIFKGTVKRYQKNVSLSQFVQVDGNLINTNKDKLNEIFERCCGYIKGHSNPSEIHNEPTIKELKVDFDEFETIRKVFIQ